MVSWSSLIRPAVSFAKFRNAIQSPACKNALQQQMRQMSGDHGHHHMTVRPSRFQWTKFKDLLHFYVMIGVIPMAAVIFYANVFIGPAQLETIPDGYEPDHWEYQRHPISRFIARYIHPSPQQEYEKALHYIFEENEKAQIRKLEDAIRQKMSDRSDYQAYYYRPLTAKYLRVSKEAADELEALRGD